MMSRSLIWIHILYMVLVAAYTPTNPEDNPSAYVLDSLADAGSLFPLNNDFPSPRVLHSMSSNSEYLMVYGGYSANGTALGDLHLYHIPSERWSGAIVREECCNTLSKEVDTIGIVNQGSTKNLTFLREGYEGDYPLPRADHSACVINEIMYVFGGDTDFNEMGLLNDVYAFNTQTLRWASLDRVSSASGSIPSRRAGHNLVADPAHQRCILFGGRTYPQSASITSKYIGLSDVWEFDVVRQQWRRLDMPNVISEHSRKPLGREHSAVTQLYGTFLYIFGGESPSDGLVYNDIWAFDMVNAVWYNLYSSPHYPYELAPPPLAHAHLLPAVSSFAPFGDTSSANSSSSDPVVTYSGLLIYGGVGTGGGCLESKCAPTQLTLGQVYYFSFDAQRWLPPFVNVNTGTPTETVKGAEETVSQWLFARLHDGLNSQFPSQQQQKRVKDYAYEALVYLPLRRIFYEFGGVRANVQGRFFRPNDQATQPQRPLSQAVGGVIYAAYSDTQSGEGLEQALLAPVNDFWDLRSALRNGTSLTNDARNNSNNLLFDRVLRVFTAAERDLILAQEYFPMQL